MPRPEARPGCVQARGLPVPTFVPSACTSTSRLCPFRASRTAVSRAHGTDWYYRKADMEQPMSINEGLWSAKLPNGDVRSGTLQQLSEAFRAGHIAETTLVCAAGSA